ncbi:four helix bundle protein [Litoribacter ruber]|uniref:four helix bundle protein n=1 Tax=Litoribacter ruber TaxID=702568 RepID=UPI001BD9D09E|nr:four helix bundle protein [Litoribacter ruber]MBT0813185.1 four helix bundle protein [Litoribacter ruber]
MLISQTIANLNTLFKKLSNFIFMKPYRTYSFEKLAAWQLAREIRLELYLHSQSFPKEEIYGLTSQLRRAIHSVSTNLAEGSGRISNSDKAHFTNIAYSSALEAIELLISAFDLGFLSNDNYHQARLKMDGLLAMLNSLYKYQLSCESDLKAKFRE